MNAHSNAKAQPATLIQADLFATPCAAPEGFRYQPNLIDDGEVAELVQKLGQLAFEPFDFHSYIANRQVVSFGLHYDYGSRRLNTAAEIPIWLMALRQRAAALAEKNGRLLRARSDQQI